MTRRLVSVGVPVPLHQTFTYHCDGTPPPPGTRVFVRFGGRRLIGIVLPGTPTFDGVTAPLGEIVDPVPVFTPTVLRSLVWAAGYYHHPIGEVLRAAHPQLDEIRTRRRFRAILPPKNDYTGWVDPWTGPLSHIRPGNLYDKKTFHRAGKNDAWIQKACAAGWVVAEEDEQNRRVGAVVAITAVEEPDGEALDLLRRRPVRFHLYCQLAETALPVPVSDVLREHPNAQPHLAALRKENLIRMEKVTTLSAPADPFAQLPECAPEPTLTAQQREAVELVRSHAAGFAPFLLEGVTGSGKTEVYLQVLRGVLGRGQGAVIIVPEIALTPQLASRFEARFPGQVSVLHSAQPAAVRAREWRALASGQKRIALGARSAVFAPVPAVGLIVVDEEHDASFKQEDGFLYNARDFALVRAREEGCPIVLGSATPSMEARALAGKGRWGHFRLTHRPVARPMPAVQCVDLRVFDSRDLITAPLAVALAENLAAGGQSILFLNRRGFSGRLQCAVCGTVEECPHCAVSLTLHQAQKSLVCHYCGTRKPLPVRCACGGEFVQAREGVEQVTGALQERFPTARIARLDRDSTRFAGLVRLLDRMRAGEIDILVGTQMIVKGHDFPGVTLVGVLDADHSLFFQDFRAAERTFQLLVQVAGRAGRGDQQGRVLVQTRRPDHHAIYFAAAQDVDGFARREEMARRELKYPPFGHLVLLRLQSADETLLANQAEALAASLRGDAGTVEVLGPVPAPISRIRNVFRHQILLKCTDRKALHALVRRAAAFELPTGVTCRPDVDPQNML
ncbi:primosomal protein N' [Myxococcota bacterium]|nr:primosomal protein N' [Myxococcota bacterium]MBU1410242.1 primosomal protein N' [Myxococcota bacterium]MBU1509876.1 primosomal protein N' [Myxococcota bacterium]